MLLNFNKGQYLKKQNLKIALYQLVFLVFTTFLFSGCGVYSFGGGEIGAAKTITIKNFYNDAGNGPASLSQTFSEKLRDYYQQNTKLTLIPSGGDWEIDGRITGYTVTSMAPTNSGTAGVSRLTIKVMVNFKNRKEETSKEEIKSFESKEFNFYNDFKAGQNLSSVEQQLINDISDNIILQIFNSTTSNW